MIFFKKKVIEIKYVFWFSLQSLSEILSILKKNWGYMFISVIDQLDVQNFCFTISLFHASTCFEHMCSKHVEAWNKLTVKQKFCASSWLITEMDGQQNVKNWGYIVINVKWSSCKVPVILSDFNRTQTFSTYFRKNNQVLHFLKIRPVGAELFHADGQTGKQASSRTDI